MKSFLKKLIMFSILISPVAKAGTWVLTKKLKDLSPNLRATEVTFTAGEQKVIYLPAQAPFGLVFQKKLTFQKTDYFVTGWAHGAATLMLRVFEPQKNKNAVLCEWVTQGEESTLRFEKGQLQVQVFEGDSSKGLWRPCVPAGQ